MKYKKYAALLSATVLLSTALVACDNKEDIKTDTKVEKTKEVKKTKETKVSSDITNGALSDSEYIKTQQELFNNELKKYLEDELLIFEEVRKETLTYEESNKHLGDADYFGSKDDKLIGLKEKFYDKNYFSDFKKEPYIAPNLYEYIVSDLYNTYSKLFSIQRNILEKNQYILMSGDLSEEIFKEIDDLYIEFDENKKHYLNQIKELERRVMSDDIRNFYDAKEDYHLTEEESFIAMLKPFNEVKESSGTKIDAFYEKLLADGADKKVLEEDATALFENLRTNYYLLDDFINSEENSDYQSVRELYDIVDELYLGSKMTYVGTFYFNFLEDYSYYIEENYELIEELLENDFEVDESTKEEIEEIMKERDDLNKTFEEINRYLLNK